VLVIRRISVSYRLPVPEDQRAAAERVHGFHARGCPVARSLEGGIQIETHLEFA
jgi:organic hydroperoxide reductase OsmC/OhrA